jgi:hypothetical protein
MKVIGHTCPALGNIKLFSCLNKQRDGQPSADVSVMMFSFIIKIACLP